MSSIEYKKDVARLEEPDLEQLLDDSLNTELVRFRYKGEAEDQRLHVGVISERSPKYMLGVDGQSINVAEYAAMLHGAVQVLAKRVAQLESKQSKPHSKEK